MQKRLMIILFLNFGVVFSQSEQKPLLVENLSVHYSVWNRVPWVGHILGSDQPKYYVARLSEVEKPAKSLTHLWAYATMKKYCFFGYTSVIRFLDDESNETFYICSNNKDIFDYQRNFVKDSYKNELEAKAQNIKSGKLVRIQLNNDELDEVFVSVFNNEALKNADSVILVRQIKEFAQNRIYGVHIIDGAIVKITECLPGDTLLSNEVLLTEEEIAHAQSIINNNQ